MEQFPGDDQVHEEAQQPERPMVRLDLSSEQGKVMFAVIAHTRQVLPPDEQELFRQELQAVTALGAGNTYEDVLALVDMYVELVDASETHPVYGDQQRVSEVTQRYQQRVIAAVDKLNGQMQTLPETTPVQIDGLYPEFDDPAYSPERYMAVLSAEIGRVEGEIEHASGEQWEALEQYRAMLRECRSALRGAGVL